MQDPSRGGPMVYKPIPHQIGPSRQVTWFDGKGNPVSKEEAEAATKAPEEPALPSFEEFFFDDGPTTNLDDRTDARTWWTG